MSENLTPSSLFITVTLKIIPFKWGVDTFLSEIQWYSQDNDPKPGKSLGTGKDKKMK